MELNLRDAKQQIIYTYPLLQGSQDFYTGLDRVAILHLVILVRLVFCLLVATNAFICFVLNFSSSQLYVLYISRVVSVNKLCERPPQYAPAPAI